MREYMSLNLNDEEDVEMNNHHDDVKITSSTSNSQHSHVSSQQFIPQQWLNFGLPYQLFFICSLFIYLLHLNHISTDHLDMILPFLALYAPELNDISSYVLLGLLGIRENKFTQYAVCPKCASLKTLEEVQFDPICRNITFKSPCGMFMVDEHRLMSGEVQRVPKLTAAVNSVAKQLQQMFLRPGFTNKLELWRKRHIPPNVWADVFDGRIWREFQSYKGKPFLSTSGNLMFQLNYDGFEPWTRRVYSVSAIYLTILNLPRSERFKKENCILVALIPPHCKGTTSLDDYLRNRSMNQLLRPMVDELKILMDGLNFQIYNGSSKIFRGLLVSVACDLPAIRKICGFMAHGARQGCSRCSTTFATRDKRTVYGGHGFDTTAWPRRTNANHRRKAVREANAKNISQAAAMAKEGNFSKSIPLTHIPPHCYHMRLHLTH